MADPLGGAAEVQQQSKRNGGAARILRALRHRNYRLFFGGQLISLVGTFLTSTAMSWLVLRLTGSAWELGVVGFASQIPMFCLAPFAGVWVDRVHRRPLLIATQTLAMVQSLALAVLALKHIITVNEVIGLALFQGLINAVDIPGRQAFLVEMVTDREDLANAIALNSTMVHGARLIGPAAAGLLIAWVGEGLCFLIDGISYTAVILAFVMMTVPRLAPRQRRSVFAEFAEGFRYVFGFGPIRVLLLLMAVISLTGMPALQVLMPIFGAHFGGPKHGAQVFGLLGTASGVGALVGALMLAARKTVVGLGRMIAIASTTFSVALLAFGFSRSLPLSMVIASVAGWGMITNFASANTILQTLADDDKRGRVMSFFSMAFIGMTPWGVLMAGALASHLGPRGADPIIGASHTLIIESLACLAASLVFWRMLPAVRKVVRPIYVKKGIIPEVATGMQAAAALTTTTSE